MAQTNDFIAGWIGHRNSLNELLNAFESSQLEYKPWDKAMSVSELVLHISGATLMFAQTVKNGVFTPPSDQKTVETIEELKKVVQEETEKTMAVIEALTDEQLQQTIEFAGMQLRGGALLQMAKDHEVHHKGQLFTYARILGAETLPNFISR